MNKREQADQIVRDSMLYTMGGSAIPVPLIDLAAVTFLQIDMLEKLALLYTADYSRVTARMTVRALLGTVTGRFTASLIKLIPGVGTLTGGVAQVAMSAASTYAVGNLAIENLETNGTLFGDDLEAAKKIFEEKFKEGQTVAEEMQDDA